MRKTISLSLVVVFAIMISTLLTNVPLAKTQAYVAETILEQRFDEETTGSVPEGWLIPYPEYGNFTVEDSVYYGKSGKCGKFVDSSPVLVGAPYPYRTFPTQDGEIILEFVMRPTGTEFPNHDYMFYIDNGLPEPPESPEWPWPRPYANGANIYFQDGYIAYFDGDYHNLRPYSANMWYRIKMNIDIPNNTYDIYVDDILEAEKAPFLSYTGEVITQLSRIHFGLTSPCEPIGYIDDIKITKLVPITSATVDFDPDTLNLKSKGKWIACYIELSEGFDVNDVNVSTLLLNVTVPAEMHPISIGDEDGDGIPDLMVKFDRSEVISYILANINITELIEKRRIDVTLKVTGELFDGTPFQGSDIIRIIMPGRNWKFLEIL